MREALEHPLIAFEFGLVVLLLVIIVALGRSLTINMGGIKAELKPNGGSSMRDAIDRLEESCDRIEKKFDAAVQDLSDRVDIVEHKDDDEGNK